MIKITKSTLLKFLEYYHRLHDSYITNINYDIQNSKIELLIDVCWSGKPILKENNTYETNKTKIKINFYDVKKYNIKEIFSWDYIDAVYIEINNEDYICFKTNEEEPLLYIACSKIEYEEIKN